MESTGNWTWNFCCSTPGCGWWTVTVRRKDLPATSDLYLSISHCLAYRWSVVSDDLPGHQRPPLQCVDLLAVTRRTRTFGFTFNMNVAGRGNGFATAFAD